MPGEDAGRQQVQGIALVADDDGVPRIVATLVADDVVDPVAEQVGGLALAFIAPLRADDHDGRHVTGPSRYRTKAPGRRHCGKCKRGKGLLQQEFTGTRLTRGLRRAEPRPEDATRRAPRRPPGWSPSGTPCSGQPRRPRRSRLRPKRARAATEGIPGLARAPTGQ